MPAAGEALDDRRFHSGFGGDDATGEDDAVEALADKLRGGEYKDLVNAAQSGTEAQFCVGTDGNVSKRDPYMAYAGMNSTVHQEDPDAELCRLRQARMAEIRTEHEWRQQGHGSLRELADEREFVQVVQPHERAVVLLDDESAAGAVEVCEALHRLSKKQLETQFCRLPVERAAFLTRMVELDGLPALFVLRNGEVTRHLPPSRLFEYSSASSPLFKRHLSRLLRRFGALTNEVDGGSSSEDEESDHDIRRDRRKNKDLR